MFKMNFLYKVQDEGQRTQNLTFYIKFRTKNGNRTFYIKFRTKNGTLFRYIKFRTKNGN